MIVMLSVGLTLSAQLSLFSTRTTYRTCGQECRGKQCNASKALLWKTRSCK